MRFSASGLFPLLLMGALAALSFWLEHAAREETPPAALRRHDPDYMVDNFTIKSYDTKGIAVSTLSAAKMLHYPDDDSTELVSPYLVQTKPDEPRMTVVADRGALSSDGDEVFLYGHVLLVRAATPRQPEARMRTSFLHVARGGSLVLSDREVFITEGSRSLSGRGMEYDNQTGELLLRQQVRGRFEPKKNG